ncbi:M48 family metallopeptidase [Thermonema rossianum]|uniref:M48 family metallopeptidase n=1 Tax=Thermonema rossianum TaxID=55505 RepID=UPI00057096A7|nr:SprT family zinc-dependent metalloprotease [Thermonema rossianum]
MKGKHPLPFSVDRIIRSKRKTIALQITEEGELWVRAPYHAKESDIYRVLLKHVAWVEKHLAAARQRKAARPERLFVEGELFYYLGHTYPLRFSVQTPQPLLFDGAAFVMHAGKQAEAALLFEKWYIEQAAVFLPERVAGWAARAGLQGYYTAVKVSRARKRWGSCSSKGSLNFSWRLMMAPVEVVDYVIVHELAHLRHHNHSAAFWQEVERQMPGYAVHHRWLRQHGHLFSL